MLPRTIKIPRDNNYQAVFAGIVAFSIWGLLVLLWYPLNELPATQILTYRIFFSALTLLPLIFFYHRLEAVKIIIFSPRTLGCLCISALLIGASWYIYIWAITQGRILEASMGYYINPLFNVLLGAIIFKERPTRLQIFALFIAFMGILWSMLAYGKFPYISILLALLFSLYGLTRKTVTVDPLTGLFIEILILLPIALAWSIFTFSEWETPFFSLEPLTQLLIMSTGIFTSIPLLLFAFAAKDLTLSTLGIIQYISPSISFLLGIFVIGEKISLDTLITFICIWIALSIYTFCFLKSIKKPILIN